MTPAHAQCLVHLFEEAPIQQVYQQSKLTLESGKSELRYTIDPAFLHGGYALHGSVYFKMLDDAAYFAASTMSPEFFLLTARFETRLLRPISSGTLIARGTCITGTNPPEAQARLFDEHGQLVATGKGHFAFSTTKWDMLTGYHL